MRIRTVRALTSALGVMAIAACATSKEAGPSDGQGTPDGGVANAMGDSAPQTFDDGGDPSQGEIGIRPNAPTLRVTGAPVTQALEAFSRATGAVVTAKWSTASEA